MIYCPKCGAGNQDGSRFCAKCGAPIPTTGIRCPVCGTMNPLGNVYCDRCHARLVPLAISVPEEPEEKPQPVKGLSLPTRPSAGEPDWLTQLRYSEEEQPAGAGGETEMPAAEIPDWLLQLGLVSSGAAKPEEEDGISPFPTGSPEEKFPQEPEWLKGDTAPESAVGEGAPEGIPDFPGRYPSEVPEAPPRSRSLRYFHRLNFPTGWLN